MSFESGRWKKRYGIDRRFPASKILIFFHLKMAKIHLEFFWSGILGQLRSIRNFRVKIRDTLAGPHPRAGAGLPAPATRQNKNLQPAEFCKPAGGFFWTRPKLPKPAEPAQIVVNTVILVSRNQFPGTICKFRKFWRVKICAFMVRLKKFGIRQYFYFQKNHGLKIEFL